MAKRKQGYVYMKDKVDILMATYQGESYIRDQIQSILDQNHQNFHLFIHDDGSTDSTLDIIRTFQNKHPSHIQLVPQKENKGIKESFSHLLKFSSSPYIMFSDQDDIWKQDKINTTLAKMKELEKQHGLKCPIAIHTDLHVVDENLQTINPSFWNYSKLYPSHYHSLNRLLIQNVLTGCTMMINRPLLEMVYPIPPNVSMHDWWIGLVASSLGQIGTVEHPTILYRQHKKNTLGAKKFYSWNAFKSVVTSLNHFDLSKKYQAQELLKLHDKRLTPEHIHILNDYIRLNNSSWLTSRYLILKNRFFKNGFLRNFVMFFLKKYP